MEDDREFEVKLIEVTESQPAREAREGTADTDLLTTAEDVIAAFKTTKGSDAVLKQYPAFGDVALHFPIATFRVCGKTGTARYLDIWDDDHFDGFTDMQRCLNDCRAWFSGDGYQFWGSGQTKTGRVNCYFTVPTAGQYQCNVRLQSYPTNSTAVVECLIDSSTYGPLSVNGTINQPHPATLTAGGHHFRIRQVRGSFFFLSLMVWKVG